MRAAEGAERGRRGAAVWILDDTFQGPTMAVSFPRHDGSDRATYRCLYLGSALGRWFLALPQEKENLVTRERARVQELSAALRRHIQQAGAVPWQPRQP